MYRRRPTQQRTNAHLARDGLERLRADVQAASGSAMSDLIASSLPLADALRSLIDVGRRHGGLYERQNLGPTNARVLLGPPGRAELSEVRSPRIVAINLASNSYLGIGDDPRIRRAVETALEQHGTHTGGSRVLCGTSAAHYGLDRELARFFRGASVVTYSSGYVTNVSVVSALFGPGDLVILDRNAHRSLIDGALLSRAAIKRVPHNDLNRLEAVLNQTSRFRRRLVIVDGVYSMEGDIAPVGALVELVHRHGAFLLVDDAHAIGVLGEHGRGTAEHFGIDPGQIDLRVGTLSKAIPSVGGFVVARPDVAAILRYGSHGTLYSAPLSILDVAAATAALGIMEEEPFRVTRVRDGAALLRNALRAAGLDVMGSEAAIVPVLVKDSRATLEAADALLARGVFVNPMIYPGVAPGLERLRCFVSAAHSRADLEHAASQIGEVLGNA
jgi:8-amino-7-oxononanoate synthase